MEKFELLRQVSEVKIQTRARRSRTDQNISDIVSVEETPGLSIPYIIIKGYPFRGFKSIGLEFYICKMDRLTTQQL